MREICEEKKENTYCRSDIRACTARSILWIRWGGSWRYGSDDVESKWNQTRHAPPNEELDALLLRSVNEILPLRELSLALRVRREDRGVPEVRVLRNAPDGMS